MKKLTKTDILNIKPGKFEVFVLDSAKALLSGRQYAYQIGNTEPPDGVARYRTKANFKNHTLVVEAVPSV